MCISYCSTIVIVSEAITNIFSVKDVKKHYRISYDSSIDSAFIVHCEEDGLPNMRFDMHPSGLHIYYPVRWHQVFVITVAGNLESFTKREIRVAELTKGLYETLAYPSEWDIK